MRLILGWPRPARAGAPCSAVGEGGWCVERPRFSRKCLRLARGATWSGSANARGHGLCSTDACRLRAVPDSDLPRTRSTEDVEEEALEATRRMLRETGFVSTEVPHRFDYGLDILASPHDGENVLPAIAGIQVRGRSSETTSIRVQHHGKYWRELNLPVFGVLVSDGVPRWVDIQAYLRAHPSATTIPASNSMDSFGQELRRVSEEARVSSLVTKNLGKIDDSKAQATSVVSLRALHDDPDIATILRCMLPALQPVACRMALEHLASLPRDVRWAPPFGASDIAQVLTHLHEYQFDDSEWNDDADVLLFGCHYLYGLLVATGVPLRTVLDAALLTWDVEVSWVAAFMAIGMATDAKDESPAYLMTEILERRPDLARHPDFAEIVNDWSGNDSWGGINFNAV